MARQIFSVNATIVGSDGTFYNVDGYPKAFDSRSYSDDIEKTHARAEAEFSDAWSAMCKRDDRQVSTVVMYDVYGNHLAAKTRGYIPEITPEPEVQA